MLTTKELKAVLDYAPDSGIFTWLVDSKRKPKGSEAGSNHGNGYVRIVIDGVKYYAHRLAFLYMTGEFPTNICDHINRDKSDNSWNNLRDVTYKINNNNRSPKNEALALVYKTPGGKWRARGSKKESLGNYDYYLQACAACFEYNSLTEIV